MKTHLVSRASALAGSVTLAAAGDLTVRIPPELMRRKLYFGLAFAGITSVTNLVLEMRLLLAESPVLTLRDRISGDSASNAVPYSATTWDGHTAAQGRWEGYGELPPFSVVERAFAGAVPPAVDAPPMGSLDDVLRPSLFHNPSSTTGEMNRYDFVCWPRLVLARADKLSFRFMAGSITAESSVNWPATIAFIGCKSEGY